MGQERTSRATSAVVVCSLEFLRGVEEQSGERVNCCYQCNKCAAGCPMTGEMELFPNQLFRLVQLGDEQGVLSSNTMWYCLSCYMCSVRCPNDIDIAKVMDTLRGMALERGYCSPLPEVLDFHRIFLSNVRRHGRVNELGLILRYNLSRGRPFRNLSLGGAMLRRRRLGLRPHRIKGLKKFRRLFATGTGERNQCNSFPAAP
ncbi:MAG: 4Fe-4S dicluster domain-containing protein [Candidatus Bipolaricaulia bacterium]